MVLSTCCLFGCFILGRVVFAVCPAPTKYTWKRLGARSKMREDIWVKLLLCKPLTQTHPNQNQGDLSDLMFCGFGLCADHGKTVVISCFMR